MSVEDNKAVVRRFPEEVFQETLQSLSKQVESFKPVPVSGYTTSLIQASPRGYEELGLKFNPEDLTLDHLYAGLSVLARDMHQYLAQHPREDAVLFEEVVSLVNAKEATLYGAGAFPDYIGLPEAQVSALPTGLAAAAAEGQPTVNALGDPGIVHEWTFKPGKRLLVAFQEKFGPAFKTTICGKDGPYEQFNKGLLGQAALPVTITQALLATTFAPQAFWIPLAVYVGLLLAKTGLEAYCKQEPSPEQAKN